MLSACHSSMNPSGAKNQAFTLAPGQAGTTKVAAIRILFEGVVNDTRCPTDLVCLVAGDATVKLQVQSPGAQA